MTDIDRLVRKFAFEGVGNILHENDFGIVNGCLTAGIAYSDVFSVQGLWAPPYVSSDFALDIRLFGEKIRTDSYRWYPFEVERRGTVREARIVTQTVLIPDQRTLVLCARLGSRSGRSLRIPVRIAVRGGLDYAHQWDFQRPVGTKPMDRAVENGRMVQHNNNKGMVIGCDLEEPVWFESGGYWSAEILLPANSVKTFHVVVTLGERHCSLRDYEQTAADPGKAIRAARKDFRNRTAELFSKLPVFKASDPRLEAFYYRSLVHYLTNRWQVPEFALRPFYSTGSVRGGCLSSYLWDFSEGWELHPLFDPDAIHEHIRQYLKIDITNCFSFNPVSGEAVGPWYPVNQEKILGLLYYYVVHTGDRAFLDETVGKRTVLDWAVFHAMHGDDGTPSLYDYGIDGEHHLELRRGYPYHGVLPDLNGRRVQNLLWASALAELAGRPDGRLTERAFRLKTLLKETLWDDGAKWFGFVTGGRRHLRYTVQMFKLIGGPALDGDETEGLLGHLNGEEFLSAYGLHSMSKKDPAYDPVDIDNGGGGICTVFPLQIIERLYKAGKPELAEDILTKILWWGERVPYWGDSFNADCIDYRSDTPLQCTIGGVAGAQCILFGLFGIGVQPCGTIRFGPSAPSFSPVLSLKGLRLRDRCYDVSVEGRDVLVRTDGLECRFQVGETAMYDPICNTFTIEK